MCSNYRILPWSSVQFITFWFKNSTSCSYTHGWLFYRNSSKITFLMSLHKASKPYFWCDIYCFQFHSIFLHMRKVRRMAGFRDAKSRVVKVEWVLNWTTFFVTRLGCHVLITYKLISDAPKFGRGIELPLALFGMAGMNLLNIILGRDLYGAYKREKNQQRRQEWRFCSCDNWFKHCVALEICAYWVYTLFAPCPVWFICILVLTYTN